MRAAEHEVSCASPEARREYRAAFRQQQAVRVPGLLAPPLLDVIQHALTRATFEPVSGGFYSEDRLSPGSLLHHLSFLVNDPALFHLVEEVTGCDRIGMFSGRVYRRSVDGHFDEWHSDTVQDRMIGMSINLGKEPFEGGALKLREKATKHLVYDGVNSAPGAAALFRISDELEHVVMPVDAGTRTVFAGWFRHAPDFREKLARFGQDPLVGPRHDSGKQMPERLRPPRTVAFHPMDDDLLVHGLETDAFIRLDAVGRRVWETVVEHGAVRAAATALSAEYGTTVDEVARDISPLLRKLRAMGLLQAA
jgi:hypothetical protein